MTRIYITTEAATPTTTVRLDGFDDSNNPKIRMSLSIYISRHKPSKYSHIHYMFIYIFFEVCGLNFCKESHLRPFKRLFSSFFEQMNFICNAQEKVITSILR